LAPNESLDQFLENPKIKTNIYDIFPISGCPIIPHQSINQSINTIYLAVPPNPVDEFRAIEITVAVNQIGSVGF
jgi:hypothetical protein